MVSFVQRFFQTLDYIIEFYNRFNFKIASQNDHIRFDPQKCTGCGQCVIICGMDLWRLKGNLAELDEKYRTLCLECAACYTACNEDAIKFL